ncbi:MAG: hypothetical protein J2P50_14625 [Hyphomicrobiaceae bacterium]|nr:hypothetical protein [Hyphomicrobiaceae bacterium]
MTMRTSAKRLFSQAMLAVPAAIIGAGLVHLTVVSHTPAIKVIAPAGAEGARAAAGPSNRLSSSPVLPRMTFRLGFLEFEDDPDASTE